MNRTLFLVFGVVAACAPAIPVRAVAIPMVFNNTRNFASATWDMEGSGNPSPGTVSYYADGENSFSGVVTAASEGISAYEGSQVLKSYRGPGSQSWATLAFLSSTSGSNNDLTTTFAIQCKDSNSYELVLPGNGNGTEDMGEFYFLGTGAIQYYNSGWQTFTATHAIGAWNTVVFKHTNSTGNWSLSVNDSPPEAFAMTDTSNFPQSITGRLRSWKFQNANDAQSTVYIDAVPAPAVPGDFSGNGVVDAADYVLWRKDPTAYLPADYNTWRSNFGNPSGSGSSLGEGSTSNVPEPGSIVLVIVACLGQMVSRRTRLVRG